MYWKNPEVSDEIRDMLAAAKEKAAYEEMIKQRNLRGMAQAMINKGIVIFPGRKAILKDGRSRV